MIFAAKPWFASLLLVLALGTASASRAGELTAGERDAIRMTIEAQMAAFQADDAERAFAYASPEVQAQSGSAEEFMAMVRQSYQPVYRPKAVFFQNVTVMDGVPTQRVLLMDAKGAAVMAVFPMQRQRDGSWRIAGCMLYRDKANVL